MNTRYILLLPLLLASSATLWAQAKVSNVDARPAGSTIAINYDLSQQADIRIYVSEGTTHQYRRIAKQYLSGDYGRQVTPGTYKKALWHILDEKNTNDCQVSAQFKVKAVPSFRPFILATGSYAVSTNNWAGGLMAGAVGAAGFYVRGETSFSTLKNCAYDVDANGLTNGKLPFYSGKTDATAWQVTGGLLVRMYIPLYIYMGGGYGIRELYWQTIDNQWARNTGYSYRGLTGDIGLMGNIHHFAIMAGISSVQFKYTTVHLGVGYAF